jgi:CubicO group peptidase (beta-lactamase class C family)
MQQLLSLALRSELETAPGKNYSYTNISFLILGVIIEAVTGEAYEKYCNEAVLNPLGITGAGLDPDWRVLSSYGGWRLSGPQYLRFMEVFAPDSQVLGRKALAFMNDGKHKWVDDAEDVYYAMGMLVRPVAGGGHNLWHEGAWSYNFRNSTNGTLSKDIGTYAVRLDSGVSWFAEYEPKPDDAAVEELDVLMYRAISAIETWPRR